MKNSNTSDLLIELFSEEIPAGMQVRAAEDFGRLVTEKLAANGLEYEKVVADSTPRRLALRVTGIPRVQASTVEEKKGPRVDAAEAAIQGFLKSTGLASIDKAEKRKTDKGEFYFAVISRGGAPAKDLLKVIIPEAMQEIPWPKTMRWGSGERRWVRPLHAIVAMFGDEVVEFEFGKGEGNGIKSGRETFGHRFLSNHFSSSPRKRGSNLSLSGALKNWIPAFAGMTSMGKNTQAENNAAALYIGAVIQINKIADYPDALFCSKVMLSRDMRKKVILEGVAKLAAAKKLKLREDDALLEEVIGLVEWPVVLMGRIEPEFMELPPEVLVTTMRSHQKYLALEDASGNIAPYFITVANNETPDDGKEVIAGNERVLRARLSDARFFWDNDRKKPLEANLVALKGITFHEKLGTTYSKVERVEKLAIEIAKSVPGAKEALVRRAVLLSKADLVSGLVGEFPELQGMIGRYVALAQNEEKEVANAIAEHYRPLGPSDVCPSAPVSVAVALADKIDTLVGFFAIGEKPTGSRDPFALRRAALGVIRLIVENGLRINLHEVFSKAVIKGLGSSLKPTDLPKTDGERVSSSRGVSSAECIVLELKLFLIDRLKVVLREKGVRYDLIDAVFSLSGENDLVRLLARVDALGAFLKTEDGNDLLTAYRRACNILRIEEKKDGKTYKFEQCNTAHLVLEEEKALSQALAKAIPTAKAAIEKENFTAAMSALASLRGAIDRFFDKVMVNDKDSSLRANRLCLLDGIKSTMEQVADFSKVEG